LLWTRLSPTASHPGFDRRSTEPIGKHRRVSDETVVIDLMPDTGVPQAGPNEETPANPRGRRQPWFADFTYLRCWEGAVFFSFVIDAYSRMIVGWQFASHMRTTWCSTL